MYGKIKHIMQKKEEVSKFENINLKIYNYLILQTIITDNDCRVIHVVLCRCQRSRVVD